MGKSKIDPEEYKKYALDPYKGYKSICKSKAMKFYKLKRPEIEQLDEFSTWQETHHSSSSGMILYPRDKIVELVCKIRGCAPHEMARYVGGSLKTLNPDAPKRRKRRLDESDDEDDSPGYDSDGDYESPIKKSRKKPATKAPKKTKKRPPPPSDSETEDDSFYGSGYDSVDESEPPSPIKPIKITKTSSKPKTQTKIPVPPPKKTVIVKKIAVDDSDDSDDTQPPTPSKMLTPVKTPSPKKIKILKSPIAAESPAKKTTATTSSRYRSMRKIPVGMVYENEEPARMVGVRVSPAKALPGSIKRKILRPKVANPIFSEDDE